MVDNELRVQWQPCILTLHFVLQAHTLTLQSCSQLQLLSGQCNFGQLSAGVVQVDWRLKRSAAALQQVQLGFPQPLPPVPKRQLQTPHQAAIRALGRQNHQARSSPPAPAPEARGMGGSSDGGLLLSILRAAQRRQRGVACENLQPRVEVLGELTAVIP